LRQISIDSNDEDMDQQQFDLTWRCRSLLLEAGADPTNGFIDSDQLENSLARHIFASNTFVLSLFSR
jgi:hypothetical protein